MLRWLQHRAGAEAGSGDHRAGGIIHGRYPQVFNFQLIKMTFIHVSHMNGFTA